MTATRCAFDGHFHETSDAETPMAMLPGTKCMDVDVLYAAADQIFGRAKYEVMLRLVSPVEDDEVLLFPGDWIGLAEMLTETVKLPGELIIKVLPNITDNELYNETPIEEAYRSERGWRRVQQIQSADEGAQTLHEDCNNRPTSVSRQPSLRDEDAQVYRELTDMLLNVASFKCKQANRVFPYMHIFVFFPSQDPLECFNFGCKRHECTSTQCLFSCAKTAGIIDDGATALQCKVAPEGKKDNTLQVSIFSSTQVVNIAAHDERAFLKIIRQADVSYADTIIYVFPLSIPPTPEE